MAERALQTNGFGALAERTRDNAQIYLAATKSKLGKRLVEVVFADYVRFNSCTCMFSSEAQQQTHEAATRKKIEPILQQRTAADATTHVKQLDQLIPVPSKALSMLSVLSYKHQGSQPSEKAHRKHKRERHTKSERTHKKRKHKRERHERTRGGYDFT